MSSTAPNTSEPSTSAPNHTATFNGTTSGPIPNPATVSEGAAASSSSAITKPPAPKRPQNPKVAAELSNLLKNAKLPTLKNHYISDLDGETKICEAGSIPISHSLYLRKLKNCEITIDTPITKLLIEDCSKLKLRLNGRVITQMLEIWRTDESTLEISSPIQTLQVDMCKDLKVSYKSKDNFASIVWAKSEEIQISIAGYAGEEIKDGWYRTGLEAFTSANPSMQIWPDIDQFIVRFLKGKVETEVIVRVGGGYASTDREDSEAVKRKDLIMSKVAETFFKSVDFKSLANHVKKTAKAKVGEEENKRRKIKDEDSGAMSSEPSSSSSSSASPKKDSSA
ncbi:hypothetical protein HDU97_009062 [Phlyctochytrium planicorne]|nr:hypothetical protein HDU97_009062 [Phlyctochytrium planicorne]